MPALTTDSTPTVTLDLTP